MWGLASTRAQMDPRVAEAISCLCSLTWKALSLPNLLHTNGYQVIGSSWPQWLSSMHLITASDWEMMRIKWKDMYACAHAHTCAHLTSLFRVSNRNVCLYYRYVSISVTQKWRTLRTWRHNIMFVSVHLVRWNHGARGDLGSVWKCGSPFFWDVPAFVGILPYVWLLRKSLCLKI